jgi:integration host factor subunit alpha
MSETVTKAMLLDRIHARVGLTKREAGTLVDSVFDTICESLEDTDKVKISGFGNWEVREKGERPGRNPRTLQAITISSRRVVTFKASQVFKAALNSRR